MLVQLFDNFCRDIRHALRGFHRNPGFTLTVVLVLALGIGANTVIFSIVDRVLLRELPYVDSSRLVFVYETFPRSARNNVSPANLFEWQRTSQSFESLASWNFNSATLTGEGEPESLNGQAVSGEFFPTLRVAPLLGRTIRPDDDVQAASHVVVLSYGLWQRRFGADPRIVGRKIELESEKYEVIGVMPREFYFATTTSEFWMPSALDRNRNWRLLGRFIPGVLGRLKPGVSASAADAEMKTIASRLEQTYAFNKYNSATVVPLREVQTGDVRDSLLVLFGAVSVLLLIACLNVASMLLARSTVRLREMAVRTSLGAGQIAIIRQLLIESLLLALAGGGLGFLLALWGVSGLVQLTPRNLLRLSEVPLDGWVLLYSLGVSLVSGFVLGLVPAIMATRASLSQYLHGLGRSMTHSVRLRQGLIVVQVTMTVVLLCGAGMLVRSFAALSTVQTGVDAEHVLTMSVAMPPARYNRARQIEFVKSAVERLSSLPGVQSAAAARTIPVIGPLAGTVFHIQGTPVDDFNEKRTQTRVRASTPGYFKTVGMPLLQGRDFTWEDENPTGPLVFVVNDAFVKKYLTGQDPLAISMQVLMGPENPYGRIIGVVGDVSENGLRNSADPTVFYNHGQQTYAGMTFFVRSDRPDALARSSVQAIHDLDPKLAVSQVRPMREAFSLTIGRERLNAVVSGVFALTALVLAALGLYGLLAFLVVERTREIGIRMALGAEASCVLRMIMQHGLLLVAAGGIAGLVGALFVARYIQTLLFKIPAYDITTFAGVAALLTLVSALAAFVPARRATKVDPMIALRHE